ncbi:hypothetical protein [Streptomyces sp. NPDC055299]
MLVLPVNGETGVVEACGLGLLPVGVPRERACELDVVVTPGMVDLLSIDIASVHEVLLGQQVASGHRGMDVFQHGIVRDRCGGGVDVGTVLVSCYNNPPSPVSCKPLLRACSTSWSMSFCSTAAVSDDSAWTSAVTVSVT